MQDVSARRPSSAAYKTEPLLLHYSSHRLLNHCIIPPTYHPSSHRDVRCLMFAGDAKIPGDAIFPSKAHSVTRCLKFAGDAKIPGGCHIPQ